MAFSKTIQMYIFDGNPNGRIMCELSNWNGRIYKVSRNELSVFSQRADAENTGVYFLLGKDENNTDTVYIGEAEKVCTRLKQHLHDADYWSDAIVVISKDDLLNKAHVKYLENRFYCLAQDSGRAVIINSTVPTCSSISEYDEAMLQEFIINAAWGSRMSRPAFSSMLPGGPPPKGLSWRMVLPCSRDRPSLRPWSPAWQRACAVCVTVCSKKGSSMRTSIL